MMENYSRGIPGTAGGRFVQSASSLHYLSRSGRMPEHSDRTGQIWFLACKRLFKKMFLMPDLVGKHNLSCSPTWYYPTRTTWHINGKGNSEFRVQDCIIVSLLLFGSCIPLLRFYGRKRQENIYDRSMCKIWKRAKWLQVFRHIYLISFFSLVFTQ